MKNKTLALTIIVLIVLTLTVNQNFAQATTGQLHVSGSKIHDGRNNEIVLRGVHWLAFEWLWETDYNTQLNYLASYGVNCIRLSVFRESWPSGFMGVTWETPFGYVNSTAYMNHLDAVISSARAKGFYVILNGWHGSSTSSISAGMNAGYWTQWFDWWEQLATRYEGQGVIYDLFNEPLEWSYSDHKTKMEQCIDNIRAIDSDALIMIESMSSASWEGYGFLFHDSYPVAKSNILYSYHLYGWTTGNSESEIRAYLDSRHISDMITEGYAVCNGEFGGKEEGTPFSDWSSIWVSNFLTVNDNDGFSGYVAHWYTYYFGFQGFRLVTDTVGTQSVYGELVFDYYQENAPNPTPTPIPTATPNYLTPTPAPTPTTTPTPRPSYDPVTSIGDTLGTAFSYVLGLGFGVVVFYGIVSTAKKDKGKAIIEAIFALILVGGVGVLALQYLFGVLS